MMSILAALVLVRRGPIAITPPGFAGKEPQVAVSGERAFVVCGKGDGLFVFRSLDGGASFSPPVAISTRGKLALGMRRGPRIALVGKSVVVSAICEGELLAWHSIDEGQTWKGPTPVSDVGGAAREGLHAMAASSDRRLACTWLDLRQKGTEVWSATSDDGGATWSKNVRVYRSPDGTVCECCHPSVVFGPRGELDVMFRNWLAGSRDMYLASSGDGGRTFSPAQKLGEGTWPLNACPMDGGALAIAKDGTLLTVWRRGQTVFACVPGKAEKPLGGGVQPWIAPDGTLTQAVWLEEGRLRSASPTFVAPAQSCVDPVVASGGLVVWSDGSGGLWSERLP